MIGSIYKTNRVEPPNPKFLPDQSDREILDNRPPSFHVFIHDRLDIWTSPNVSKLLVSPPPRPSPDQRLPSPKARRYPQWYRNHEPWLGFWPRYIRLDGRLFGRLLLPKDGTAFVSGQDERGIKWFHLNPEVRQAWAELERTLQMAAQLLLSAAKEKVWAGLGMPHPSWKGYAHRFNNLLDLTHAIEASISEFVALSAYLSFAIAVMTTHPATNNFNENRPLSVPLHINQSWAILLGLEMSYLNVDDLIDSMVGDFQIGSRPGVYVDAPSINCPDFIAAYARFNLPVWIRWGTSLYGPFDKPTPSLTKYRPMDREVTTLQVLVEAEDDGELWLDVVCMTLPQTVHALPDNELDLMSELCNPTAPDPHFGSGQRQGENVGEFLARRKEEDEMNMQYTENDSLVLDWKQWQKVAEHENDGDSVLRPSVGRTMYQWYKVVGGTRRVFVPQEDWATVWAATADHDRHFFASFEEWDLVMPMGVDDGWKIKLVEEVEEVEDMTELPLVVGPTPMSAESPPASRRGSPIPIEVHAQRLVEACPWTQCYGTIGPRPASEIADVRYGWKPLVPTTPPQVFLRAQERKQKEKKALYGNKKQEKAKQKQAQNGDNREPPWAFFHMDALDFLGLKHHPCAIRMGESLQAMWNWVLAIDKLHYNLPPTRPFVFTNNLCDTLQHCLRVETLGNLYLIGVSNSPKPFRSQFYLLGLHRATDLLQVLRSANDISESVALLVDWGIPFRTLKCWKRIPVHQRWADKDRDWLGEMQLDRVVTAHDYQAYQRKLEALLANSSIILAAVKQGGITWRLVKHLVDTKKIQDGPSLSVIREGHVFADYADSFLIDDELTENEGYMIVGTYRPPGDGPKTERKSWWPSPKTWNDSKMNVGYWSADAEEWFQNRLLNLATGDARLKNAGEWRKELHGSVRKVKEFQASHDLLARQVFERTLRISDINVAL